MWDSFLLNIAFLIEGNVVLSDDRLYRSEQLRLVELSPVFNLYGDPSLHVEVVVVLEDIVERGVLSATVDRNLVESVSEVVSELLCFAFF